MSAGRSWGRNSALSLRAPCWDGVVEGPSRGWQFPMQAWVRADLNTGSGLCWGSLRFPQEGWKEEQALLQKKQLQPPVCLGEKGSGHLAPVWHVPVTEFPGTNWVKFNCLGNVQFLKLRVFLSKTHKINDLTLGACFAH